MSMDEDSVRGYILSQWGDDPKCEMCWEREWMFSRELMTPITFIEGGVKMEKLYPSVLCICRTCGNTKMINAVVAGLLEGHLEC